MTGKGTRDDCVCYRAAKFTVYSDTQMPGIYIKVRPDTEFEIEMKTYPVIGLEAEASQGRANSELLRRLEEITGEKPAIILGHKSRRKKLKIEQDRKEFKRKLREYNG